MHVIAGKSVAFGEALKPEFKDYCLNVVSNANVLAQELLNRDFELVSGGTDTHLVLIDLSNKNMVPFDSKSPMVTSGIRIGTPALTTRGMSKNEMIKIAALIDTVISNINDDDVLAKVKFEVEEICHSFKLYPHFK